DVRVLEAGQLFPAESDAPHLRTDLSRPHHLQRSRWRARTLNPLATPEIRGTHRRMLPPTPRSPLIQASLTIRAEDVFLPVAQISTFGFPTCPLVLRRPWNDAISNTPRHHRTEQRAPSGQPHGQVISTHAEIRPTGCPGHGEHPGSQRHPHGGTDLPLHVEQSRSRPGGRAGDSRES